MRQIALSSDDHITTEVDDEDAVIVVVAQFKPGESKAVGLAWAIEIAAACRMHCTAAVFAARHSMLLLALCVCVCVCVWRGGEECVCVCVCVSYNLRSSVREK